MPNRPWPLAVRLEVLPGGTLRDKFCAAADFGFDAVELPGRFLPNYRHELIRDRTALVLPVSSLSLGFRGSLVSADPETRQVCRRDLRDLLSLCADLGAVGLIVPPALRTDNPALVTEGLDGSAATQARDNLLLEQLPDLADHARARGVKLLLEPVNRYETEYLNTLDHAVRLCDRLNHAALGITADAYHMQLEELRPVESVRRAGSWIRHVHVAENTRVEPGPGSLNLLPLFRGLKEINYQGFVVVECRSLSGPAETALPAAVRYLDQLTEQM